MIIMNRNTSPISPFTDEDYMVSARITEENQYPEKEILRFLICQIKLEII